MLANLKKIDHLSITLLMDNFTDRLLPSCLHAKRPPMIKEERFLPAPIAEHGFSAIIEIQYDVDKINRFLFDTGVSNNGIIFNADLLEIDLKNIDAIILSHGHLDHFTGIVSTLQRIAKPIDVIVHPDAFQRRWLIFPDGTKAMMPVLDEKELEDHGAIIHKHEYSSFLPTEDPHLLITGEIPRETSFEKGFPLQYSEIPDKKEFTHDPLIKDDQAIVANIEGKGLVVITGCGHAGIVNTLNYAKKLSDTNKIHAILGGFHLTGSIYEQAIEPTITELQSANPDYIIPCHCTGWKATNRIIQIMSEKFIQTSVGTSFSF
ncbi:MAG TPA: MBL fold metallo-hydrolase [Nitrososphaeraceae archaeon]|nr:MBL fold metallo-hydrolase [Nitrososphaeraceae archaeon]